MSQVKVVTSSAKRRYDLPLYFIVDEYGDLYGLIKDVGSDRLSVVSISTGYLQTGMIYNNIEEFIEKNRDIKIVDLEINAVKEI